MSAKILSLKMSVLFAVLIAGVLWFFTVDKPQDTNTATVMTDVETIEPLDKNLGSEQVELQVASVPDGVTFNAAQQSISLNVKNTARLLVVQRVAEIAGFDFSLPDHAIDYWSEPVNFIIDDEPLAAALSTIIGAQPFALEMSYDTAFSLHKISAVFLTANSKNVATATPLDKKIPLPVEREISEAPDVNFSANSEQQSRRANFFTADEQTRVAILQEMSPVGADLDYIIASVQRDKNPAVRAAAAQRLSFSESYAATQTLLDALADSDPDVVKAAANSLIALGDASVIPAMEAKLGGSEQGKTMLQEANQRIRSRFSLAADGNH